MAARKITVDGTVYKSKKAALDEFYEAMCYCDGSEAERMMYAYIAIKSGFTNIDTYNETAE